MKHFKFIFLIAVTFLLADDVFASSVSYTTEPITNEKNRFLGINMSIEIPEDYNEKIINITPDIFGELGKYTKVMPGDRLLVNLDINNLSKNNYKYVDKSFILTTSSENREQTSPMAFDGLGVSEFYYPYRTVNTALKALLGKNISRTKINDENIDNALKVLGYTGIDDLYKYYTDFYGDVNSSYDLMMQVFNGSKSEYKESNKEVIVLSFDYFYKKLLSVSFKGDKVTDKNSEDYSIYSYMSNNTHGDDNFKKSFNTLNSNTSASLNDMYVNVNGLYTVNSYMNYNFSGTMSFKLVNTSPISENIQVFEEDDTEVVDIPKTGI